MEITKLTMLRIRGIKSQKMPKNLFEFFGTFNGKFGAEFKMFTENNEFFEVFYMLPNEADKRALRKHISKQYPVSEAPVVALKVRETNHIEEIFDTLEMKAQKMGGEVARRGHDDNEGTIVFTFDKENVCNRFGMWAIENFNE